jgi:hypothetical protein
MQRAFLTLLGTATCLAGSSVVAFAQTGAAEFDSSRAILRDSSIFEPFYVEETVPLRQALEDGTLEKHTPLALMDHPDGRLTLVMSQLMYHHLAQGEINGEPWMVSF